MERFATDSFHLCASTGSYCTRNTSPRFTTLRRELCEMTLQGVSASLRGLRRSAQCLTAASVVMAVW